MAFNELKLVSWFAYAVMLFFISIMKLQPGALSAPLDVITTLLTQSFEVILLIGLVLAIANIQRGKQWFWKVINGLLALGILSLLIGILLVSWHASFTASVSLVAGVLALLPMQYKLFVFAYSTWPIKEANEAGNLRCCSDKV